MNLSHSLIVCLGLGVGMSCLAASETQQEGVGASVDLGEAVRSFLSALVDPDSDRGLSFFGQIAIANRLMLNEPCFQYISEEERQSETARQFMIRQFLEGFSQEELAGSQFRSELALIFGQRVTSDPIEDSFLLIEASFDELVDEDRNGAYLRELLPPSASLSVLPLESGGVIAVIWALESGAWKIAHISIPCV